MTPCEIWLNLFYKIDSNYLIQQRRLSKILQKPVKKAKHVKNLTISDALCENNDEDSLILSNLNEHRLVYIFHAF